MEKEMTPEEFKEMSEFYEYFKKFKKLKENGQEIETNQPVVIKEVIVTPKELEKRKMRDKLLKIDPTELPTGGLRIQSALVAKRCSMKKHEKGFGLTDLEIARLISSPCTYCGIVPNPYHGVDRINSDRGYTKDNVVSCCKACNTAKMDRDLNEFIKWGIRLGMHLSQSNEVKKAQSKLSQQNKESLSKKDTDWLSNMGL